ncbi:unnamed protein product [Caenorhabditis auriculariae]|uniref:Uncharacterized protein n=1 Tax=Caenorhabditis auriculariae TaxID=2777116 RepID=A0A8S1HJF7_9PELO|nr:unnamed protein product [Caenorhabditis auriculariae]
MLCKTHQQAYCRLMSDKKNGFCFCIPKVPEGQKYQIVTLPPQTPTTTETTTTIDTTYSTTENPTSSQDLVSTTASTFFDTKSDPTETTDNA